MKITYNPQAPTDKQSGAAGSVVQNCICGIDNCQYPRGAQKFK